MRELLRRFWSEDEAATAVEYAIISAVVGVALIGTLVTFQESIAEMLDEAADAIAGAD